MRLCSLRPKLLCAFLLLLPTSTLSFSQTESSATIDCSGATPGAFSSVQQAILGSPDHTVFTISGSCTENFITIQRRNDLSFITTAPATLQVTSPNKQVLLLNHSENIPFGPI